MKTLNTYNRKWCKARRKRWVPRPGLVLEKVDNPDFRFVVKGEFSKNIWSGRGYAKTANGWEDKWQVLSNLRRDKKKWKEVKEDGSK